MPSPAFTSDVNVFTDDVLTDPYATYEALRETAPAVWLPNVQDGVWAITRHADAKAVLDDAETFSSVNGLALTPLVNQQFLTGTVLATDGADHARLRRPLSKQLNPRGIRHLTERVERHADELVAQRVKEGAFDAAELSTLLVTDIVMELMGLPGQSRETLVSNAHGAFDSFGPENALYQKGVGVTGALVQHLVQNVTRETVVKDSWMGAIFAAADAGEVEEGDLIGLMLAYLTAGMDTAIFGIGNAIHLLATHPEQWELLRENPDLALNAFFEALRLEAPVQSFGRRVTKDTTIGEVPIAAGEQVWVMYGSTGRDPRQWGADADAFRIQRPGVDQHLAYGSGAHSCAGNHLANLEATALLQALATRCATLTPDGEPTRMLNNTLRGYERIPVTLTPAV